LKWAFPLPKMQERPCRERGGRRAGFWARLEAGMSPAFPSSTVYSAQKIWQFRAAGRGSGRFGVRNRSGDWGRLPRGPGSGQHAAERRTPKMDGRLRVGIIGTGRPRRPGPQGFGMAWQHADAYQKLDSCVLAACADISEENREAFARAFGVSGVYEDYREMLEAERLDVVSICTWPRLHGPMAIAAAEAGVTAIHCEKPMADTWAMCRRMAEVCARHGAKLTFNHQRR